LTWTDVSPGVLALAPLVPVWGGWRLAATDWPETPPARCCGTQGTFENAPIAGTTGSRLGIAPCCRQRTGNDSQGRSHSSNEVIEIGSETIKPLTDMPAVASVCEVSSSLSCRHDLGNRATHGLHRGSARCGGYHDPVEQHRDCWPRCGHARVLRDGRR